MADNQSNHTGGAAGASKGGSSGGLYGSSASLADQARETLRGARDKASDAWKNASEYGARCCRQGNRAVSDMDSSTMTALFIAGALGFGLGWLAFGQRSDSGDYVATRVSWSSERHS